MMKYCIFPLIYLLLSLLFSLAQAQEKPAGGVWTLEECIKYAIKNNVEVMQSDLQVRTVSNNLQQSKISRYPNLNANASQNFNFGRSVDPFTNQFVNQQVNSNNFSLSASVNLFNGFQISQTIRQNQVLLERNQLDVKQAQNNVALNVALNYLNILLNQELLAVAEKNVQSTKEQLERTQKLFDAGAVAEIDVINLKSTLANNELAVVTAQNNLLISKVNLQQNMNIKVEDNFQVKQVNIEALEVKDFAETPTQIFGIAESTQANIKSADLTIKSSEYGIELAKSNLYPSLTLNGVLFSGYSSATRDFANPTADYPFFDQIGDNFRQQVSLNLSIPIFNQMQTRTQIANAKINKTSAELQAVNLRIQLRQTIEQAYVDAKNALNTYNARVKQLEANELTFETTEKRYNAGAANVVDFNIARINRDNSRSDVVRAKYDFLFRKKILDFYMDKPLDID